MGCCGGGYHGNNHENQNNDSNGYSNPGSRVAIIIGVLALAGVVLYFIK